MLAKEKRGKGIRSVKVQPVGSLDIRELLEVAQLWSNQARAAGRRAPEADSAKVRRLIKRFESARAEAVAHTFATVVTELFSREMQQG